MSVSAFGNSRGGEFLIYNIAPLPWVGDPRLRVHTLVDDLFLLSRVCSRHIKTYTFLNPYSEESSSAEVPSDLLRWRRIVPVPVPESVSGNMVIPSLESSELGSAIKDPFKN